MLSWISLGLSCLGCTELSELVGLRLFPNLKSVSQFSSNIFYAMLSFFSLPRCQWHEYYIFCCSTTGFWCFLLIFYSIYSLLLKLGNFSSILMFTNFFCPLYSTIAFVHWILILVILCFSSKILIQFFCVSSISLLIIPSFSLFSNLFVLTHWGISVIAVKSMSYISKICVILMLESVDYLLSLRLRFSLFLDRRGIFVCIWDIFGYFWILFWIQIY